MQNLMDDLMKLLKKDERLVAQDGVLLKNQTQEFARKNDPALIKLLLSDKAIKQHFFFEVEKVLIFDKEKFVRFVSNKQFLPDSYTTFKNKIGLTFGDEYLSEGKEVVLAWPYKDCVLEGGMTKEDQERDEIFYNEILAPDDINRLLDPKVFTNFRRIDKKGENKLDGFKRDAEGTIKDNLIIKGNNLLALASLKKEFSGKVKLIYIDPPYNPKNQNNTFSYNNSFNRSTWLTFMRNRLLLAKQLLREDGVLQVAIDKNEQEYLGVLIDSLFSGYEKHCITIVHNPRGVQGDNFSYSNEYVYFVFKKGLKVINKIKREPAIEEELRKHGGESLRNTAKNCFYPIIVKNEKIVGYGEVPDDNFHPKERNILRKDGSIEVWPIDVDGIERKWIFARQSVEEIESKLSVKTKPDGSIDIYRLKDEMIPRSVWVGKRYDASTFGSKIVNKVIDGKTVSFPKSLYAVYDCVYSVVKSQKDSIVIDFFSGSGTTANAVINLNIEDGGERRFILIEQLEEHVAVAKERIRKEFAKNKGGDFVYMELAKWNEEWVQKIKKAKTGKELVEIWKEVKETAFLSYKIDPKTVDANAKEFADLGIADQKKFLVECLDKNQLYINLSEIEDKEYGVSKEDKALNKSFYNGK